MITTRHLGTLARLRLLFLLLAAVPLVALGWLGWRLLEQDRTLERQQLREKLANDAGLLAAESEHALAAWEGVLTGRLRRRETYFSSLAARESFAGEASHYLITREWIRVSQPPRFSPMPRSRSFRRVDWPVLPQPTGA